MGRQWLREVRLTIGDDIEALDVSQLRVRFDVRHPLISTPATADITITNLAQTTTDRILSEYTSVLLQAGYPDDVATIFQGEIVQKFAGRETAVDTYIRLIATESAKALWYGTINKTLAAGHSFKDQVDACLEALKDFGVTAGKIPDLGSRKIPRGVTLFGMVRDVLSNIAVSTDMSWRISGNKLNFVPNRGSQQGDVVVLNSRSGLVGLPVRTFNGIEARCLLNPRIITGALVRIDQASIQDIPLGTSIGDAVRNTQIPWTADDGIYKVLTVDHLGDTRGNEWYTDIVCIRADGEGPYPENYTQIGVTLPI